MSKEWLGQIRRWLTSFTNLCTTRTKSIKIWNYQVPRWCTQCYTPKATLRCLLCSQALPSSFISHLPWCKWFVVLWLICIINLVLSRCSLFRLSNDYSSVPFISTLLQCSKLFILLVFMLGFCCLFQPIHNCSFLFILWLVFFFPSDSVWRWQRCWNKMY